MNRDQIACLLIVLEAVIMAVMTHTGLFPLSVAVVAVLATWRNYRAGGQRKSLIIGLLAAGFRVKWSVAPYEPTEIQVFLLYSLAHVAAQFLLAAQLVLLIARGRDEPPPALLPFLGVGVLIGVGDLYATPAEGFRYRLGVLAFLGVTAMFFWLGRPRKFGRWRSSLGRVGLSCLALGLTVLCTWTTCGLLVRHWDELEQWLNATSESGRGPTRVGFERESRIGSVQFLKSHASNSIALRVVSRSTPGYLRGAAYDEYLGNRWLSRKTMHDIQPRRDQTTAQEESAVPRRFVLSESAPGSPPPSRSEIWTDTGAAEGVFLPLETQQLAAAADAITVDEHKIVFPSGISLLQPYEAQWRVTPSHVDAGSVPALDPDFRAALLKVPPQADEEFVAELARKVTADARSPGERIDRVQNYFQSQEYELGVHVPNGLDPLIWFLRDRPAAHCEYFAAGALVLLRHQGIPCRYVTGFMAHEKNVSGEYWVARNADAHAWVEAWVEGEGWRVVEATPRGGVPSARSMSVWTQGLDDLRFRLQKFRAAVAMGGAAGAGRALALAGSFLLTTPAGLFFTAALSLWLAIRTRGLFRRRRHRNAPDSHPGLHHLLARVDALTLRLQAGRQPGETLHQFATRLETTDDPTGRIGRLATWYRSYAQARYADTGDASQLSELASAAARL